MIKTINTMGIELDNYTVREAIMIVEKMLSNNEFNTIEEVTMDMLMLAGEDECVKEALQQLDHTVIAETGILDAVGEKEVQRTHEIKDHDFFFELFKRLERNHKTVFIVGETEADNGAISDLLQEEFPRLKIIGSQALENNVDKAESIVNEINSEAVDVILSCMMSPTQEHFLVENKGKLSANLWYGIGNNRIGEQRKGISFGISNLMRTRKLARHINNYEEKREEE